MTLFQKAILTANQFSEAKIVKKKSLYLFSQLMKHVRLPLVSRDFLMTAVDSEPLVRENPECLELLLEAMKYHLLPEQRSSLANHRTEERRPEGMQPYIFAIGKVFFYLGTYAKQLSKTSKFIFTLPFVKYKSKKQF